MAVYARPLLSTSQGPPPPPATPPADALAYWAWDQYPTWEHFVDEKNTGSARTVQPARCLEFDGTNDYVDLSSNIAETNATYCFWVLLNSFDVTFFGSDPTSAYYLYSYNSTDLTWSTPGGELRFTVPAITTGVWNHIAFTRSGNLNRAYLNGVESSTGSQFSTTSMVLNQIGRYGTSSTYNLDGRMADVRVYSSVLTESDLLKVMKNASDQPLPTAHWWHLEEGSGTTAYDAIGGGNNGTLTNGPTWTTDTSISKSWANDVGYTDSSGVVVPRNESNTSQDATGGSLQYSGVVPKNLSHRQSNCVQFDGVNDYIDCGDSSSFSFGDASTDSAFSVFARVNMDVAANFGIVAKSGGGTREWDLQCDGSGRLTALLTDDVAATASIGRRYNTGLAGQEGSWIHVGFTYSGNGASTGIKVYLDGSQVDDADVNTGSYTAMHNTTDTLKIGYEEDGGNVADGYICDVRIYSSELSAANVAKVFNQESDQPLPTAGWYPLAEGSGSTSYNAVTNANHGTHTGGPSWGTLQDEFHYNVKKGFRESGAVRIPALNSGVSAADGNAITNPAVIGHNDAESLINWTAGASNSPFANPRVLDFDGTNQYVDCGDVTAIDSLSAMTFSCWAKQDVLVVQGAIMHKGSGTSDIAIYTWTDQRMYVEVGNGSNSYGYFDDYDSHVNAGEWFHVAFVFDGGGAANADRLKLYINGVERTLSFIGGGTIPSTLANMSDLSLGRLNTSSAYWDGALSDARFYNTSLSEADLNKIIQDASDQPMPTLTRYKMNEGFGTTTYDSIGSADGTINGATWISQTLPTDYAFGDTVPVRATKRVASTEREDRFTFHFD